MSHTPPVAAGDTFHAPTGQTVNTVLGPIPASELGVVAVHEALLSVIPGAQYAPDISMDRAEIFEILAAKLTDFREHGGRTIVDSTGMFHGRDVKLYEALSRSTGVHIVASTGMGPEEMLGGYFLTPQTNPPTPWPAEKFADLFSKEVTEGMVVPRVERRGAAGLVTTTADRDRHDAHRGEPVPRRGPRRPEHRRPGLHPLRRRRAARPRHRPGRGARRPTGCSSATSTARTPPAAALEVAGRGAFVGIDHVGLNDDADYLTDHDRAALVLELVEAGHADKIILSGNAIGVAKGQPDYDLPFSHVLSTFVPFLKAHGLSDEDARRILVDNPRDLLTVR